MALIVWRRCRAFSLRRAEPLLRSISTGLTGSQPGRFFHRCKENAESPYCARHSQVSTLRMRPMVYRARGTQTGHKHIEPRLSGPACMLRGLHGAFQPHTPGPMETARPLPVRVPAHRERRPARSRDFAYLGGGGQYRNPPSMSSEKLTSPPTGSMSDSLKVSQ